MIRLSNAKKEIFKLRKKTGTIQSDRSEILKIAEFYEDLFTPIQQKQTNNKMSQSNNRNV